MAARLQIKRGTSQQWAASDPVLFDGQMGIDKDTGIIKVGDGFTIWSQLPIALSSQYLPILGKAADSQKLDGLDSTDFLRSTAAANFLATTDTSIARVANIAAYVDPLTSQTSATRKLVSHWGVGTVFPTVSVLQGDTYVRTDLGTNGSLWHYNGGASGFNGWVHKGPIICTSTTRPIIVYNGLEIYETDTGRSLYYNATDGKWRNAGISVDENINGTIDVLQGVEFQFGMFKVLGNNTATMSSTVTFPKSFAANIVLMAFANAYGFKSPNGAWAPLTTTNWEGWTAVAGDVTQTQMVVRMRRNDGATFGTAVDYYVNWMVLGKKA